MQSGIQRSASQGAEGMLWGKGSTNPVKGLGTCIEQKEHQPRAGRCLPSPGAGRMQRGKGMPQTSQGAGEYVVASTPQAPPGRCMFTQGVVCNRLGMCPMKKSYKHTMIMMGC